MLFEEKTASREREIVDYYESCEIDYKLLWNLNTSLAMHAGYWDDTTKTLHDALVRENHVLAEAANIGPKDRVLDAGCGVGGSSIFLAKHYGCHVTGISLSEKQVEQARAHAFKHVSHNLPLFHQMDFAYTTFADASFDVIWGIESICHTYDKLAFIKEAYRLLKPGGRIVVADGFVFSRHYTTEEAKLMEQWLQGWGVKSLAATQEFNQHLEEGGFTQISFKDITPHVLPSSKRMYYYSIPAFALSKIGELVGLRTKTQTNNIRSAFYQYQAITKGLWQYGIFRAEKGD